MVGEWRLRGRWAVRCVCARTGGEREALPHAHSRTTDRSFVCCRSELEVEVALLVLVLLRALFTPCSVQLGGLVSEDD